MRLDPMALLEDCESIQLSTMHVVDGLVKGTLDTARARLILEALRMAAAPKNLFASMTSTTGINEQPIVPINSQLRPTIPDKNIPRIRPT